MKKRDIYLNKLISFREKSLIKVITGVRRCGKSTLLDLFEEYLLMHKTPKESIIKMNFESLEFDNLKDYKKLYEHIKEKLNPNGITYLLLDEIQQVSGWEKAINSLRLDKNTDIYLTGSNAHMLSSELSTLLSGRYVEIKMLPLSFAEYIDFNDYPKEGDLLRYFNEYIEVGSFPGISELLEHKSTISPFLSGIYNTIIMKDVIQRNTVRDPALLESLVRFMANNIGKITSIKKISDYLTSLSRKTTSDTIDNYLKMLEDAYILYRCRRYDLKGKQHLKTQEKFYFVDMGIRNEILGFRNFDYGFILENIVYFELLKRGFEVSIGKINTLEVDFIATKSDKLIYYQVTQTMINEETKMRELTPLKLIPDNYEKVILSMDRTPIIDYEGIKNVNIIDFLLE